MSERTYTTDEFRVIIRKALDLEARISSQPSQGLTRDEIIAIARDSGIAEESITAVLDGESTVLRGRNATGWSETKDVKPVIRGDEMSVEQWISINPTNEMIELLLTELDNRFHASDKESWWSSLWGENVKVKKNTRSTEWKFTDKDSDITTRVLLQSRGDRFRIRVSRKQNWGVGWDFLPNAAFIPIPILSIVGGVLGYHFITASLIGVLSGIGAGLLMGALSFPFLRMIAQRISERHANDLIELADELVDYAVELHDEVARTPKVVTRKASVVDIEIDHIRQTGDATTEGRLKNQLRS
ncbi:MAG: hypothetical protein LAT52_13220 [Balneolales bacterium]|nr:hypothetical protein [Balneolales bacterium]